MNPGQSTHPGVTVGCLNWALMIRRRLGVGDGGGTPRRLGLCSIPTIADLTRYVMAVTPLSGQAAPHLIAMPNRRFPPPWDIEDNRACFSSATAMDKRSVMSITRVSPADVPLLDCSRATKHDGSSINIAKLPATGAIGAAEAPLEVKNP
jgi:hypothetical protein